MKVFVILALALVAAAEPPVDSYGMQPPARNAPSSTYGAPQQLRSRGASNGITGARFTGFDRSQYSAPSNQYAAPSAPAPVYGAPNDFAGYAASRNALAADDMSEPASYEYRYEVNDGSSGSEFGHQEQRDGDVTHGEYRVLLPDGRTQVVKYEADENGFRPEITYIEADQQGAGYARGPANGRQAGGYNY
ncbi:hypothetical protein B566_EDAN004851 [Ephemera danica]|nr:hypothetical protein B566_EDAN004851 [Ephemera danica]